MRRCRSKSRGQRFCSVLWACQCDSLVEQTTFSSLPVNDRYIAGFPQLLTRSFL